MGHEYRGSWPWEDTPQPPKPKALKKLERVLAQVPTPMDYEAEKELDELYGLDGWDHDYD